MSCSVVGVVIFKGYPPVAPSDEKLPTQGYEATTG